jgi:hypothetical protein
VIIIRRSAGIAVCVLVLALAVLLIHLTATSGEFSRYNPEWNGTSRFFDSLDRHQVTEIADPALLAGYTNTTLLMIAPEKNFTAQDLREYRDYISRGNTLVLADDFSTGESFLKGIGSTVQILPGDLSSVDRAYNSPFLVVAYPVNSSFATSPQKNIIFDKAAAVSGGDPRVTTSLLSWTEENGTLSLSSEKLISRYSVEVHETLGRGDIYVIGDPSIFINGMQEADPTYANQQYIHSLAGNDGKLLVDTYSSRAFRTNGIREIFQEVQTRTEYKVIVAAAILGIIGLAWHRKVL